MVGRNYCRLFCRAGGQVGSITVGNTDVVGGGLSASRHVPASPTTVVFSTTVLVCAVDRATARSCHFLFTITVVVGAVLARSMGVSHTPTWVGGYLNIPICAWVIEPNWQPGREDNWHAFSVRNSTKVLSAGGPIYACGHNDQTKSIPRDCGGSSPRRRRPGRSVPRSRRRRGHDQAQRWHPRVNNRENDPRRVARGEPHGPGRTPGCPDLPRLTGRRRGFFAR